jgi:hypothetical protein
VSGKFSRPIALPIAIYEYYFVTKLAFVRKWSVAIDMYSARSTERKASGLAAAIHVL